MQGLHPCLVIISSSFEFCTKGGIYVSETFLVKIYVCHMNLVNLTVSCINYSKLLETTKVNIEQACFGLFFKVKTIVCNNTILYYMYLAKNFSPKVHIM